MKNRPAHWSRWDWFLRMTYPGWWIRRHIMDPIAQARHDARSDDL